MYAGANIAIELLYGAGYARSGETLAVLALAIPPLYLGILLTQALIARDRHGTYLCVSVLGVVLNVAANWFLIPRFAEIGAAAATVATELAIAVVAALGSSHRRAEM
jgi:O-antigen/teichoic acid export membrane protein